ncbi:MAG TPA: alcohol dehydrogenase catalytic domain-containing protein [bacterium]
MDNERYVLVNAGKGRALQWTREPLPQPEPGEVRVKLLAAGVAYSDFMRLRGVYDGGGKIPYTPGWDLAGVVDAVGAGVAAWQAGQSVVALTVTGNFTRYRTLAAEELIAMPPAVDPAAAVSLGLNYVTAYQMLHRLAKAKAGETVLVHGAAGGVGTAALQLGRIAGLKMYGVASKGRLATVTAEGA